MSFLFSRTRGSAGDIANPYTNSYCLSTFYFSKFWKNLTSYAFSRGKICEKYFRISCELKIRENYSVMTPNYGSFKAGDSTRSRFLMRHAPPCDQRRGVDTQCHADAWPGFGYVMPSYAFFCGVEHGSLLGWSVSVAGWAVRLHAVFMRSFSRDRDRAGCAEIGSGNRTKPWLAPIKWGWSALDRAVASAVPSTLESISGTPTLGPELTYCPCNVPTTLPSPHQANAKGKQVLGVGTLEGRELPGENTWGTETSRGIAVISCDSHLIGGH